MCVLPTTVRKIVGVGPLCNNLFSNISEHQGTLLIPLRTFVLKTSASQRVVSSIKPIGQKKARLELSIPIQKMPPTVADYGTWKSPITSKIVATGGIRLTSDIEVDQQGRIFWAELRSSESGRCVICSWKPGDQSQTDWTPEGFNARTRASEYGGGSFFLGREDVYFSNFKDQRLYQQSSPESVPQPITSDLGGAHMFADGQYVTQLKKVVCVREDHSGVGSGDKKESHNSIVSIDPVTQNQHILVEGADFYSSPRVSRDGKQLAWTQWDHPNMPWDTTEIWKADLNPEGTALLEGTLTKVAGQANNSVILPGWNLENQLFFIDDQSNYWNLHRYEADSGTAINLLPTEHEIGGPQWIFGLDGYAFSWTKANQIFTTQDKELGYLDVESREFHRIVLKLTDSESPIQLSPCDCAMACSPDGSLYLLASSPSQATQLIRVDPETGLFQTIKKTLDLTLDEGYISVPEKITFSTSHQGVAHAYLYLPKNKDYVGGTNELPPLMVRAHGGPTASTSSNLNLKHQYLTSRGFAVLDVDYRGSTGYGRTYRELLNLNWGIYDVEDVCHGALHLVQSKKVDGKRLAIDGGSAGGYTTLAALTFKDVFQAGISNYGVSDLEALAKDTHKFESRYMDQMIGPYPEAKGTYDERSPIHHTEDLNSALAFFQGGDDKVVPPSQAEDMFQVVKKKGLPTVYVLFPEEQHGFRDAKNVKKAIDGEFYFLSKVFGFEAYDLQVDMEILNLQ